MFVLLHKLVYKSMKGGHAEFQWPFVTVTVNIVDVWVLFFPLYIPGEDLNISSISSI